MSKLEMRKLSGQDLYPVITLMGKLGVKDMVRNYFKSQKEVAEKVKDMKEEDINSDTYQSAGLDFIGDIVETAFMNIERIKPDLNRLFADLCGVKVEVIVAMELEEYTGLLFDFFAKPELVSFFKSISLFMSR